MHKNLLDNSWKLRNNQRQIFLSREKESTTKGSPQSVSLAVKVAAGRVPEQESCGQLPGHRPLSLDASPLLRPANLRGRHPRCHWQQANCTFSLTLPQPWPRASASNVSPDVILLEPRPLPVPEDQYAVLATSSQLERGDLVPKRPNQDSP